MNLKNEGGDTALALAAFKGEPEIAKSLIAAGADVNSVNSNGDTALILATRKGSVDCVKFLIEAGADVNPQEDSEGKSALIEAAKAGNMQIATALLQAHANVAAKDNEGKTAIEYPAKDSPVPARCAAVRQTQAEREPRRSTATLWSRSSETGLEERARIDFSKEEITQATVTPDGVKLTFSTITVDRTGDAACVRRKWSAFLHAGSDGREGLSERGHCRRSGTE